MIWALTLKPGQECTHEGLEEVHLSLASLECRPGKCHADGPSLISYLLLRSGRSEHVLCTLEKGHATQQNLDLVLQPREKFTLSVEGSGIVYVTGYSSRPPEDESEAEEEGIIGRIEYEEPLHTIVKQEPEDDFPWEQRDDEGSGHGEGHVESATIHEAPESPQFLEEDGQVSLVNEEEIEQLNQLSEPPSTSQLLEVDGGQHSLIFEQNAVLIKVEPEEMVPENEDTNNVQNQGETSGVSMRGSDTDAGGIASRTRNAIHTVPPAGDTAEGLTEPSGTQQTEDNAENDSTTNGYSDVASNEEGGVFELSSRRKAKLGTRLGRRHPRSTIKRVLPSRRGVISSRTRNAVRRSLSEDSDGGLMQVSDFHQNMGTSTNDQIPSDYSDDTNISGETVRRRNLRPTDKRNLPLRRGKSSTLRLRSVKSNNNNESQQKTHVNTLSDEVHVCQTCGMMFGTKYHCINHEKLHASKIRFKCRFCDQGFATTLERSAHESSHTEDTDLHCQFCGKLFKCRRDLCDHENTHTGKTPYQCNFCYNLFSGSAALKRHERRSHNGNRFDCEVCGKSFARKYCLKEHMNIHASLRPYKCKYCDKTYSWKTSRDYHESTHNKDPNFTCNICGKGFYYKRDALTHGNVHAGVTPFTCRVCNKGFSGKKSMIHHMRIKHMVKQKVSSLSHQ